LHIVLARLYQVKRKQTKEAVDTLRRFIRNKGKSRDKDVADALFNVACYLSIDSQRSAAPEIAEKLQDQSLKALAEPVKILPPNAIDAQTDPDLEALRATDKIAALSATFKQVSPSA
jgi:hypothetical protein